MDHSFSDKEFNQMMFNPVKVPANVSIFKFYPDLKKHKIFLKSPGEGIDNEKLMTYILCMYDKNTPYRQRIRDVLKRKIQIAHDVGFEIESNGVFTSPVEDFLKGNNQIVNDKIVEYVRMHRSFSWSYFIGIENSYYAILTDVVSGQSKRIQELKTIQSEIETTMLDMLNEDNNGFVKDNLLRYMETERLELRPEDIAIKLQKNEQPISFKEIQ